MTTQHDWSQFTVRVDVKAPVEKLYRAWATRGGIGIDLRNRNEKLQQMLNS